MIYGVDLSSYSDKKGIYIHIYMYIYTYKKMEIHLKCVIGSSIIKKIPSESVLFEIEILDILVLLRDKHTHVCVQGTTKLVLNCHAITPKLHQSVYRLL